MEAGKSAHGVFGGAYPFGFAEGSFQRQLQGGSKRRRKWSKAPGFNSLALFSTKLLKPLILNHKYGFNSRGLNWTWVLKPWNFKSLTMISAAR